MVRNLGFRARVSGIGIRALERWIDGVDIVSTSCSLLPRVLSCQCGGHEKACMFAAVFPG